MPAPRDLTTRTIPLLGARREDSLRRVRWGRGVVSPLAGPFEGT